VICDSNVSEGYYVYLLDFGFWWMRRFMHAINHSERNL